MRPTLSSEPLLLAPPRLRQVRWRRLLCFAARVPMAERVTGGRPQHGRVGKSFATRESLRPGQRSRVGIFCRVEKCFYYHMMPNYGNYCKLALDPVARETHGRVSPLCYLLPVTC